MPSEIELWSALRSYGRQYRAGQHPSSGRKRLRALVHTAAGQHWSIAQISEATTLAPNTIRKYITK